ncbi:S8/S53 family peptidase [Halomonas sp.]|uniref:S8/S53 family peptidase n=1 Tax=Halomonas sp. TaxID=1486246 RepID=UPI002579E12B|nr:S8/S53 family peptidase [Halomonas sp.]MCJ8287227.1 S8/S53 family peptidase [Halomonas sp.]NQY71942.1 S8/S53 family peptidase [Halomonas sp.]
MSLDGCRGRHRGRIAVLDSGVPAGWLPRLADFASLCDSDDALDRVGHGGAIIRTLDWYGALAGRELVLIKLFDRRLTTTATRLAMALELLADEPPDWVLVSAGLARDEPRLAAAVATLVRAGSVLVASSARHGAAVYPASCPGVKAVSGDARRLPGQCGGNHQGRALACAWAVAEGAWQPWWTGPPPPGEAGHTWLAGSSFAAAHALGQWIGDASLGPAGPSPTCPGRSVDR